MRRATPGLFTCSLLLAATAPTLGQSPSAGPPAIEAEPASIGRDEAISLVRALDPRFAGLPDYEAQRKESARSFSWAPLLASSYVRVLPTTQNEFADPRGVDFRYPAGWLIETTLVADCSDLSENGMIVVDPCAWRHTWVHYVTPDGTVATLHDTGDPEPMPSPSTVGS